MQTILVVEDDETLRYAVVQHLAAAGYNVIAVGDGMAALSELDTNNRIDLLLLDVVMPSGNPHGLALARMARRRRPKIPVIFMTGHPDLIQIARELPAAAFMKPVDLAVLMTEIKAQLPSE